MTYQQIEIGGCETPILAAVDPGKTGCIIKNRSDGSLEIISTPRDSSGGIDLEAYTHLLKDCTFVLMEHPPMKVAAASYTSEESCHCQYMQLYGLLSALCALNFIPGGFHACRPEKWQDFLGFPKKSEATRSIYDRKIHASLPKKEKDALKNKAQGAWKGFLADQAHKRFPAVKFNKEQADAILLFDVARKIQSLEPSLWP